MTTTTQQFFSAPLNTLKQTRLELQNKFTANMQVKDRFNNPIVIFNFVCILFVMGMVSYKINSSKESIYDNLLLAITIFALLMNVYLNPIVFLFLGLIMASVAYNLNLERKEESNLVANEAILASVSIYVLMVVVNLMDYFYTS